MKRTLILTILFLLAAPAVVFAQPSVPGVRYVSVAPTGSCSQSPPVQVLNSSGAIYTCNNGTWAVQGGSSGVTQITAGTNVTISPSGGTGNVTINASEQQAAQYLVYTASSTACTPGTSGTVACARNNVTGSVDYSNADFCAVMNSALSASIMSTGGEIYLQKGSYQALSATQETTSPYTTRYYCVGIPAANVPSGYTFKIDADPGTSLSLTTTAEGMVPGGDTLIGLWVRPTPNNSLGFYWGPQFYVENLTVFFPTNTHGHETGISALEASQLETIQDGVTYVTGSGFGVSTDIGIESPATFSNGWWCDQTTAYGMGDGFDVNTEHTTMRNCVAVQDLVGVYYGKTESRNGQPITHGSDFFHLQLYDDYHGFIIGSSSTVSAGDMLNFVDLDLEYAVTGPLQWADGVTEVQPGLTGGIMAFTPTITGTAHGSTPLATPFAAGSGANYTIVGAIAPYTSNSFNIVETSCSPVALNATTGFYWNNTSSTCPFDLAIPTLGLQQCFGQYQGRSGALSLIPPSGVTVYYQGAAGTPGSATGLVSSGVTGDFICVVGTSTTTYQAIGAGYGTWTNH